VIGEPLDINTLTVSPDRAGEQVVVRSTQSNVKDTPAEINCYVDEDGVVREASSAATLDGDVYEVC